MRYQDYVARAILTPLDLEDTGYDDVRRVLPHRAMRYSYYEPTTYAEDTTAVYRVPDWNYSHNMGAGNMYATAGDLARFGRALVGPGLLSSRALELLHTRGSTAAETPWTYGWFLQEPGQPRRLHITGSNAGLQAALYVYPDDDLIVVILSNTWGIGSRSAEMVVDLPERLATICIGRPDQGVPPR